MRRLFLVSTAAMVGFAANACAQTIGVDVGIGTTGAAAHVQAKVMGPLVLRGGYNYLAFEPDDEEYDGVSYSGELDMSQLSAFVDYHPFGNGFTLTGGYFFGDRSLDLSARPTEPVEIGDETFTPSEVGTLSANTDLGSSAPYVGLGWDGTVYGDGGGFHGFIRLGVLFSGTPEVELSATGGTLTGDPTFQEELAREEQNLQDEVDQFEVYPVINLGLSWGF